MRDGVGNRYRRDWKGLFHRATIHSKDGGEEGILLDKHIWNIGFVLFFVVSNPVLEMEPLLVGFQVHEFAILLNIL